MKKILSPLAILLGAALLVFAIALPTYVVPSGKKLPLNLVSTTGTDPIEGNLLDSRALAAGKPVPGKENLPECSGEVKQVMCFMHHNIGLQSQRFTVAQEPSNDKEVTLEVGTTLFRTDVAEPRNLLNATVERITLDRKNQLPVNEPVSTIDTNAPALGAEARADVQGNRAEASVAPFTREGVQYQFPMGTDKKSYPYFDVSTLSTNPIDFVGEEEQDGVPVYRFEQTLEPTEIYPRLREALEKDGELSKADEGTLASLRLAFPAEVWGVDPAAARAAGAVKEDKEPKPADAAPAEGENADAPEAAPQDDAKTPVEMSRYYTVNRTIWVEPRTGVIVNGGETVWQYYAMNDEEAKAIAANREEEIANPRRTATYFPAIWNDKSREGQMAKARDGFERLHTMGVVLPWILGILGLILIVVGILLHRSRRS